MSTADSAEQSRPAAAKRRSRLALIAATAVSVIAPLGILAALAALAVAPTPALAGGPLVNGGGSSYAAIAINQWAAEVQTVYGDTVNYNTSSSVIGLNEFAQSQIDFGASEIGYSTGQAQGTPPERYQYLPDVAGAECIMYNLKGITGSAITQVRIDQQVMADIFSGQINYWDAAAIKALNPGLLLPHTPIIVVWRSDASGDNYLFTEYLTFEEGSIWNAFSKAMGYPEGADALFPFPQNGQNPKGYNLTSWQGAQGSDIASNDVAAENGAITYVETGYALLHNKPCAYIRNQSGNYVAPSEENDAVALEGARLLPDLEQKLDGVYTNPLPSTYPISAYSYLITQEATEQAEKGKVLGQFILFLACQGQQSAGQLGYSPLPPNLVADDFKAVDRINGAAAAPATPTAANCKNPYVDGQTHLPGEPTVIGQSGGGPKGRSGNKGHGTTATGNGKHGNTGTAGTTKGHGGRGSKSTGHGRKAKATSPKSKVGSTSSGVLPPVSKTAAATSSDGFGLLSAVTRLEGRGGPDGTTSVAVLAGVLLVLGVPPLLLAGRRRRRRALVSAEASGQK